MLSKDEPATWWNRTNSLPPSDLDQVVAASHIKFKSSPGADVTVRGWPKEPTLAKLAWIKAHSDHGCLFHGGPEGLVPVARSSSPSGQAGP